MIVTLTAHPSVDLTVTLAGRLERGAVLRADRAHAQAGGKGVNISRAAAAAGVPTLAVIPADADDAFVHELVAAGVPAQPVGPAGAIRTNITISEADGTTTKVNSTAGPAERGDRFQFERVGYFYVDPIDSKAGKPVFNRTVTLRDSWAKEAGRD